MSPRDPRLTQSDAPQLVADLIRELQLIGAPVGLLDFASSIQPVFILGSRGLTVVAEAPVYNDGEVISFRTIGVAANEVLIDTGALAAGVFDIKSSVTFENGGAGLNSIVQLEHRNAANTATLSTWRTAIGASSEGNLVGTGKFDFSFRVIENERFRIVNSALDAGINMNVELMFHRRPDVT